MLAFLLLSLPPPTSLPLLSSASCPRRRLLTRLKHLLRPANHLSLSPNFIPPSRPPSPLTPSTTITSFNIPILFYPIPLHHPHHPHHPPPCRHDIFRSSLSQININPRCATSSSGIASHPHCTHSSTPFALH
ncbi:hypothetical protein F5882DRAFT_390899 [Hyaloscypha sp. PMI_1271]|nr:hypothetical protein F5882DRAFT_390899 [Hyaloscypha sp. PMI_1271]